MNQTKIRKQNSGINLSTKNGKIPPNTSIFRDDSTINSRPNCTMHCASIMGSISGTNLSNNISTLLNKIQSNSILVYSFLMAMFLSTYSYDIWLGIRYRSTQFITNYIYIGHWNISFQVFFLVLELFSNTMPNIAQRSNSFRGKFLYSIIFPFTMWIALFYWFMQIFNQNSLKIINQDNIPGWYNQIMHTAIVPAVFVECLTVEHELPNLGKSVLITVIAGTLWIIWITLFGVVFNHWALNFVQHSSWHRWPAYYIIYICALILFHQIGRAVHQKYWTATNFHCKEEEEKKF